MPEGAVDGKMSVEIGGSGEAPLGTVTFAEAGDYVYTITEIDGGKAGWTYDNTVYTLTVKVSRQGGNLVAQTTLTTQRGNEEDTAFFANQWEEPSSDQPSGPVQPGEPGGNDSQNNGENSENAQMTQTGDNRDMTPWIVLSILSGGSLAAILIYKRKTAK